ncbi:hypothetical protein [Haloglomus litoreum]|uniref:hypothetical protein n=1 Tax=Haloglomus litoreum TaxID=3034026 RepID=UPI0023E8E01F|nr:hypothetical protein [Haloglomus sp. DT116]
MSADSGRGSGLTRYDLVLLCIPVTFLVAAVASLVLEVPAHTATAAGGLASAFVLADALFRNPPLGT